MTPAAERQRKYRRRLRDGLIALRIAVDHVSICEALIAAGLLRPADYDDPRAIAAALERATIEIKNPVTS
jgi:hypothetical protein